MRLKQLATILTLSILTYNFIINTPPGFCEDVPQNTSEQTKNKIVDFKPSNSFYSSGLTSFHQYAELEFYKSWAKVTNSDQANPVFLVAFNTDGTLDNIKILKSSGNPQLDETSIIAIKSTFPLPPFIYEKKVVPAPTLKVLSFPTLENYLAPKKKNLHNETARLSMDSRYNDWVASVYEKILNKWRPERQWLKDHKRPFMVSLFFDIASGRLLHMTPYDGGSGSAEMDQSLIAAIKSIELFKKPKFPYSSDVIAISIVLDKPKLYAIKLPQKSK